MKNSNLPYLVDRFFLMLKLQDGINTGSQMKDLLYEKVSAFLDHESPDTAYDVYLTFIKIYGLTLPNNKKDFIDLLNMLHEYEETAATLIEKQRDHFVHAVNVFLIGLAVYAQNESFRNAVSFAIPEKEYTSSYSAPHEEFFFRWGLASLFHDIGYPIEIVGQQINRYIRIVTDADGDEVKVKASISYENFDELNQIKEVVSKRDFTKNFYRAYPTTSYIDMLKPIDLMAHRIHLSLNTNLKDTLTELNHFIDKMASTGFIDHGYYSSLILLKWYGYLIQTNCGNSDCFFWSVVDSATAILLHNYYKNALQKAPFNLGPMSPADNPIAFLLILSDEIQEWNRTARGILTKTFILADAVNISVTDQYLGINYVTQNGLLPEGFCREKEDLLRHLLNIDALFPVGFDVDNVSVNESTASRLAIAIHAAYNEKRLRDFPGEPLAFPKFSDLPLDLQSSNLRQANGFIQKLHILGYDLLTINSSNRVLSFPEDDLEEMARLEHEDWVDERKKEGWSLGEKDVQAKKSPYLIPYDDLSEEIKDYDRDAIRNIPKLADMMGMAVYRQV